MPSPTGLPKPVWHRRQSLKNLFNVYLIITFNMLMFFICQLGANRLKNVILINDGLWRTLPSSVKISQFKCAYL